MQAITDIKHLTVQTLPPILVLTGEDVGQFEWLKKDILKKIGYDPSDLNYSFFDMKEASYAEVELDLVSLPFFADEKNCNFGSLIGFDHCQETQFNR